MSRFGVVIVVVLYVNENTCTCSNAFAFLYIRDMRSSGFGYIAPRINRRQGLTASTELTVISSEVAFVGIIRSAFNCECQEKVRGSTG